MTALKMSVLSLLIQRMRGTSNCKYEDEIVSTSKGKKVVGKSSAKSGVL